MRAGLRSRLDRLVRPGSKGRAVLGATLDKVVLPAVGGAPPGLKHGVAAPDQQGDDAPVVLVVLLGADDDAAAAAARWVAEEQWLAPAFVPVFVVDRPVMPVLRRAGYVVELVAPGSAQDLTERLVECRRSYATDRVVVVSGSPGTPDLPRGVVAAMVTARPHGVPLPGSVTRALRRFERWYDRSAPS
jgi:hypothetical protein